MLYKIRHCARHVSASTRAMYRHMHRRVWDCIYTIQICECIYIHVHMEVTSQDLRTELYNKICSTVGVTVRDV